MKTNKKKNPKLQYTIEAVIFFALAVFCYFSEYETTIVLMSAVIGAIFLCLAFVHRNDS